MGSLAIQKARLAAVMIWGPGGVLDETLKSCVLT